MLSIKGKLFTKPMSLARITILGLSITSILMAGVLPFSLFLYAALPFEAARYLGSFMFYAGLATMLTVGLTTQFKPNWKLRKQALTLSALAFMVLATFAVVEAPAVNALTPLPTDRGVNNSAPYKFSVPFTEYQWVIAQFRDGTYYAINGSDWNIMTIVEPWQSVPPWAALSTNKTALIQQALTVTTAGKILLNELTYPYSCTIPTNVAVIESYRGLTRQFISSANTQGSPYTISIDTVNAGYYLAQDGQGRFLDEWSSTNQTSLIDSVTAACTAGDSISIKRGVGYATLTFNADTKLDVQTAGASIAAGQIVYCDTSTGKMTLAKADSALTMGGGIVYLAVNTVVSDGKVLLTNEADISNSAWSWTPSNRLYVSAASGGAIIESYPSTSGNQAEQIGIAKSATTVIISVTGDVYEIA